MSIDVSGPEFDDLYPTLATFKQSIAAKRAFKPDAVDWIADIVSEKIRGGASYRAALEAVTRAGTLLTPQQLRDLGANPRRKLGDGFVASLANVELTNAIAELEDAIIATTSNANKLHNLRRYREAGVTHCSLSSAGDERCTELEQKFDGKRLTIDEATDLVKIHGSEITRSVFRAEIEF